MVECDKLELVHRLNSCKKDIVFVGGISEVFQGKRENTIDIDICVLNTDGLCDIGVVKKWNSNSIFSKSGLRAGIEVNGIIVDIFIEEILPSYIEIQGIKFEIIESLINRYRTIIEKLNPITDYHSRQKMISKLENLVNKI